MKKLLILVIVSFILCNFVSAYTDSVYVEDYDLSVQYDSVIADDIFSLVFTIFNDASSEKNLTIEFDEDNPFEFVSDDDWSVLVDANSNVSKTFRIEVDDDAESKTYDLEFNLDDGDDDWDDSFSIKVSSDKVEMSLGEIISSPKKIVPNLEEVSLEIALKNKGDKVAEDLVATLILPEGFEASSSYSNVAHIGDLEEGEVESIIFYFDTEKFLSGESYSTKIQLEYECDAESEVSYLELELPVFDIPQFEIIGINSIEGDIEIGKSEKLQISIKNIGGEDAKDVTLKVYERSDQPFSYNEKSVYVGSLDVGEIGYAVFEFDVDPDAEAINYFLDFQVRSVSGESVLVDDLTTFVSVKNKNVNYSNYLIYFVLLSVLSLAGLIVTYQRRK
ncbi:MAG: hypothetical protein OQK82_08640 [Candidatus Pacearchaeota archaeon]|nr:hypothetical protein [Candidatus Pacearchaeota archaeon]